MGQLNEDAFKAFFSKVISPVLKEEEETIKKLKQLQMEEEKKQQESLENENTELIFCEQCEKAVDVSKPHGRIGHLYVCHRCHDCIASE